MSEDQILANVFLQLQVIRMNHDVRIRTNRRFDSRIDLFLAQL